MANNLQNKILSTVDLRADVATWRQSSDPVLIHEISNLLVSRDGDLDELFQSTCRRITVGYALRQNILQRSGMRNFKPAIRRLPAFLNLTPLQQTRIENDMKYIKCIYENWTLIVRNCTLPMMTSLDIRPFPLWKLAKCITLNFVEKENAKGNCGGRRPTQRAYRLSMVDDIVENVDGSTQTLLDLVGNDEEQIKKIADDFHKALLRRIDGGL